MGKPKKGGGVYQHLRATGELNASGSAWKSTKGGTGKAVVRGTVKGVAFVLRGARKKGK